MSGVRRRPDPPPELDGYTFVRVLGVGGFSTVFLYEQHRPRREVAVKVLVGDRLNEDGQQRFAAEADVMAALSSHPYIVTIYETGIAQDGRPYLAMEYFSGSHLGARIRHERVSVAEALQIGVHIASAVETAHRSGVVHRDIKPSNVLTSAYNKPGLADFGIASGTGGDDGDDLGGLSVPWSPPEAFTTAAPLGTAADVYSLGALVYHLLAGRSPFESPSGSNRQQDVINRIRESEPLPIERDDVPADLDRLLMRTLDKNPENRPPSALAFARALQGIEESLGLGRTPIDVPDPVRRTTTPVAAVAVEAAPDVADATPAATPGAAIGSACSACGAALTAGARFCRACGARAVSGEAPAQPMPSQSVPSQSVPRQSVPRQALPPQSEPTPVPPAPAQTTAAQSAPAQTTAALPAPVPPIVDVAESPAPGAPRRHRAPVLIGVLAAVAVGIAGFVALGQVGTDTPAVADEPTIATERPSKSPRPSATGEPESESPADEPEVVVPEVIEPVSDLTPVFLPSDSFGPGRSLGKDYAITAAWTPAESAEQFLVQVTNRKGVELWTGTVTDPQVRIDATDVELTPNTKYTMAVTAVGGGGDSEVVSATFHTPKLPTPAPSPTRATSTSRPSTTKGNTPSKQPTKPSKQPSKPSKQPSKPDLPMNQGGIDRDPL